MIDRSPNNRQAESDIDGFVKGQRLEGNETLIVIHADVAVDIATFRRQEGRIWRQRALHLKTLSSGCLNRRHDDAFLFPLAKQAMLAGVWIEAADCQPWWSSAQSLHGLMAELQCLQDSLHSE